MPTDTSITPLTPDEVWSRLDPLQPSLDADPARDGLADLPYPQLKGPGFERLCYELLVAEGATPRFFGRSGQKDLEVDIIVDCPGPGTLYQCKNLSDAPSWGQVQRTLERFEEQWLGDAGLPRPTAYVYCCPHPLDDSSAGQVWSRFRDAFEARTKVSLDFRDKHYLDTRLRQAPDLVAGLFSPSYAEHFCRQDDWIGGPWTRITTAATGYPETRRFLTQLEQGRIHVRAQERKAFDAILEREPALLIRGFPGVGKSTTGLKLACTLHEPIRRVYYASLSLGADLNLLVDGIKRRRSLPSLFFLDDCHRDPVLTGHLLDRLHPLLNGPTGRTKLVLCQRDVADGPEDDETRPWLTELAERDCVLTLRGDLTRFRAIVEHRRKDLVGLGDDRLERLHHQTGGDLLLLDETLKAIDGPTDLDQPGLQPLYRSIRQHCFEPAAGGGRAPRELPTVLRLACLAQFELVPLADYLRDGWLPSEQDVAAPLMLELYSPRRYLFLHASMAELIARALVELDAAPSDTDARYRQHTHDELVGYLGHLARQGGPASDWIAALETLVRNPLRLIAMDSVNALKAGVLADAQVQAELERNLRHASFSLLSMCLRALHFADHPAQHSLVALIVERFRLLFALRGQDPVGIATLGTGFLALAKNAPDTLRQLEQEHGPDAFIELIAAHGTLVELFKVLEHASPTFRTALRAAFDEPTASALVDKTIAAGRSIGTLDLALRELADKDRDALEALESRIGAKRFLGLIVANGTLYELFKVLEHASPSFRTALLAAFDESTGAALVDKTIAAGRSIGTLSFTLRELGKNNPNALAELESRIGAARFLKLIVKNGTLFELFRVVQYASPDFRTDLLTALDEPTAGDLVNSTIAAGQSIESFGFTLRALARKPEQRRRLETAIGAATWWRLLVGAGTLHSLMDLLETTSPEGRDDIIANASSVSREGWRALICRGYFCNATEFFAGPVSDFDADTQATFATALEAAAVDLAAASPWRFLRSARLDLLDGSPAATPLKQAWQTRIAGIDPAALVGLDFVEAINGFALAWEQRADLRVELAKAFERIIPDSGHWPREKGEIAAFRFVLSAARSAEFPAQHALGLVDRLAAFLDPTVCKQTHTLTLFLLAWNLAAVRIQHLAGQGFTNALPADLAETLFGQLKARVKPTHANKEKLAQFALAGLLRLIKPESRDATKKLVSPLANAVRWLAQEALSDQVDFVTARFAFEGMALLRPHAALRGLDLRGGLMAKYEQMAERPLAVDRLAEPLLRARP